ncbi:hypothetical protein [Moorena producens]|uniref:hypothetical protein n=1 Tax=Moorena producens TaxID=1155739 RepID=UPI003C7780C9
MGETPKTALHRSDKVSSPARRNQVKRKKTDFLRHFPTSSQTRSRELPAGSTVN